MGLLAGVISDLDSARRRPQFVKHLPDSERFRRRDQPSSAAHRLCLFKTSCPRIYSAMRSALIWTSLALTLGCSESSGGGPTGTGGRSSGGAAGQASGGSAGAGLAGSNTGGAAGTAGASGSGTGGIAGHSASGAGGSGAGGSGGGEACAPVTLGALIVTDTETGGSSLAYELQGLDATLDDVLYVEFFDVAGAQTSGSFDLSQAPDDNYSTCAHCLLGFEDVGGSSTPFYPESGNLIVTQADTQYTGVSSGQFENVILRESTLESSVTTPVSGGKCWLLTGSWTNP